VSRAHGGDHQSCEGLTRRVPFHPSAPPASIARPTAAARRVSIDRVSDAELVERARQGDPAAFGELVERHRAAVYRAALAALRSPADAEDAAQDAFLAAYRRLNSFRGEASFQTWLLTIAWHHAINRRRSLTAWLRRLAAAPPDESGCDYPSRDRTPEDLLAAGELR